jgi:hypothetical protein
VALGLAVAVAILLVIGVTVVLIATGVNADGRRDVLGLQVATVLRLSSREIVLGSRSTIRAISRMPLQLRCPGEPVA